ncbi:hypothetical protein ABT024_01520 [Streptomyces sp. NPDC002812]|uniref:hypothetical protein n=1 Tax=Streptomyces sp. NPDC002812 TaxID=3154434 RepID=UPI00331B22BD
MTAWSPSNPDCDPSLDADRACGEGHCQCYCGGGHDCGCDCPRCPWCQQSQDDCECDD